MKPTKSVTTHYFRIERLPEWPDLPWPEWKPETKKMMRPMSLGFNITVEDGNVNITSPYVYGQRILSSGELGANVTAQYILFSSIPPFIKHLIDDAKRCIAGPNIIPVKTHSIGN